MSSMRASQGSRGAGSTRRALRGGRTVVSLPSIVRFKADDSADSPSLMSSVKFLNPDIWQGVKDEQTFLSVMQRYRKEMPVVEQMMPMWQDFFQNHTKAVAGSGKPGNTAELAAKIQAMIADCVIDQIQHPHDFGSMNRAVREPFDYYSLGQLYTNSLLDNEASVVGHPERWARIASLLAAGENVVLLSNHATEADPGVWSALIEGFHSNLATDIIYVAGDRVYSDPLWIPFSMGRNLFCVHSKKHIDDDPELKKKKQDDNRRTVVTMQKRLNLGNCLLWVAPSGGRDRPRQDGKCYPSQFDPSAVALMQDLVAHSKKPGHIIPMAMYSYPICPPPLTVDKALGERRLANFSPVGISCCEELDVAAIVAAAGEDKAKQAMAVAKAGFDAVTEEYVRLEAAILQPATRGPQYVQPRTGVHRRS